MIAALLPLLSPVLDKLVGLIPDPAAAAKAKAEALAAIMAADAAQLEVNKVEASSSSMFVAGWRPFVGWVCAAGCAWNWIGLPMGVFIAAAIGHKLDLRPADLSEMLPLLLGVLGMGGLRTFEKTQGVAR
ncbi:MAG: hypothetical protein EBU97_01125 [Rhodobacteraceae bacterium]|nr:hypothetical protein [Paracoccaceae bacterium]